MIRFKLLLISEISMKRRRYINFVMIRFKLLLISEISMKRRRYINFVMIRFKLLLISEISMKKRRYIWRPLEDPRDVWCLFWKSTLTA